MSEYDDLAALVKANADHAVAESARAKALQYQLDTYRNEATKEMQVETWRQEEYQKLVDAAEVRALEQAEEKVEERVKERLGVAVRKETEEVHAALDALEDELRDSHRTAWKMQSRLTEAYEDVRLWKTMAAVSLVLLLLIETARIFG